MPWALLFVRLVLGLMFFMLGAHKVFVMTPIGHAQEFFVGRYSDSFLPVWSLWLTGVLIPFVELVAGGLVFVGFRTKEAAIALGCVLVIVTFGHLLADPFYQTHTQVFPRLVLVVLILVVPRAEDRFSVEALIARSGDRSSQS